MLNNRVLSPVQVGYHLEPHHGDAFKYLTLGLMDVDHEDLVKHFKEAFAFIDEGRKAGKYNAYEVYWVKGPRFLQIAGV
jgi:hypothetical protein